MDVGERRGAQSFMVWIDLSKKSRDFRFLLHFFFKCVVAPQVYDSYNYDCVNGVDKIIDYDLSYCYTTSGGVLTSSAEPSTVEPTSTTTKEVPSTQTEPSTISNPNSTEQNGPFSILIAILCSCMCMKFW